MEAQGLGVVVLHLNEGVIVAYAGGYLVVQGFVAVAQLALLEGGVLLAGDGSAFFLPEYALREVEALEEVVGCLAAGNAWVFVEFHATLEAGHVGLEVLLLEGHGGGGVVVVVGVEGVGELVPEDVVHAGPVGGCVARGVGCGEALQGIAAVAVEAYVLRVVLEEAVGKGGQAGVVLLAIDALEQAHGGVGRVGIVREGLTLLR